MRIVVQRVKSASVLIGGETAASIGNGLLLFVGIGRDDTEEDAAYLAEKTAGLRIFEDAGGKMNLSCAEMGGEILVVSQFTLYGDCRKGRRPSFTGAMEPIQAQALP
ncbi:MAG: D-tyrosyl-tRNA(Tyr) deacylase, partial [Deltaproteobacteria bacterium]|nr:D-tyrosyl-tRNA(Tyr) deacylase [Deltaproteobacteria bacterium]